MFKASGEPNISCNKEGKSICQREAVFVLLYPVPEQNIREDDIVVSARMQFTERRLEPQFSISCRRPSSNYTYNTAVLSFPLLVLAAFEARPKKQLRFKWIKAMKPIETCIYVWANLFQKINNFVVDTGPSRIFIISV